MTSAPAQTAHQRGVLILLVSTLAWSTAGLFVRAVPLDAFSLLGLRGPAGAIGLFILILVFGRLTEFSVFVSAPGKAWLYTCVSAAAILFYIPALTLTTIAHVAIIYATVPFVAAVLGFIVLRERPSASAIFAIFFAVIGVALMAAGPDKGSSLLGDLLAVGMTICSAWLMILGRRPPDVPMLPPAAASTLLAGLIAIPFAKTLPASPHDIALTITAGLIANTLGFGLFVIGSRLIPVVETALIGALETPLAPLWVWLAFGETPSPTTILGGALVTLAVLGHLWLSGRGRVANAMPDKPL